MISHFLKVGLVSCSEYKLVVHDLSTRYREYCWLSLGVIVLELCLKLKHLKNTNWNPSVCFIFFLSYKINLGSHLYPIGSTDTVNFSPCVSLYILESFDDVIMKSFMTKYIFFALDLYFSDDVWRFRGGTGGLNFRYVLVFVSAHSVCRISVPETLGSNPAFSRGGQLVSFRLENHLPVPDHRN